MYHANPYEIPESLEGKMAFTDQCAQEAADRLAASEDATGDRAMLLRESARESVHRGQFVLNAAHTQVESLFAEELSTLPDQEPPLAA